MSVKEFVEAAEERIRKTGVAGGAGTGAESIVKARLNAKGCPVLKVTEKADVLKFRPFITTV